MTCVARFRRFEKCRHAQAWSCPLRTRDGRCARGCLRPAVLPGRRMPGCLQPTWVILGTPSTAQASKVEMPVQARSHSVNERYGAMREAALCACAVPGLWLCAMTLRKCAPPCPASPRRAARSLAAVGTPAKPTVAQVGAVRPGCSGAPATSRLSHGLLAVSEAHG